MKTLSLLALVLLLSSCGHQTKEAIEVFTDSIESSNPYKRIIDDQNKRAEERRDMVAQATALVKTQNEISHSNMYLYDWACSLKTNGTESVLTCRLVTEQNSFCHFSTTAQPLTTYRMEQQKIVLFIFNNQNLSSVVDENNQTVDLTICN